MKFQKIFILFFLMVVCVKPCWALDRSRKLGLGYSSQMANDLPSLSFKFQRSKAFALGGVVGYSSSDSGGGYGAGLKVYRILFDEPLLNFYAAALFGLISQKNPGSTKSGYQADFTLGSEFSFMGLQSLGFSVEFGISLNKIDDFNIETVGKNFIVAGVHFYI